MELLESSLMGLLWEFAVILVQKFQGGTPKGICVVNFSGLSVRTPGIPG